MDSREFDRLTTKIAGLDLVDLTKVVEFAQATITEKRDTARKEMTAKLEAEIREAGLDPAEFLGGKKTSTATGQKMAAKYQNPDDPNVTWGGRGKRPNWINNALASGRKLDDMLIKGAATTEETKAA